MRILLIGATGLIGGAIHKALAAGNEIIGVTRKTTPVSVDITDVASLRRLFEGVGKVDAIVSAAGTAAWKPVEQLTDEDMAFSLGNKLMGQVNVIRYGLPFVGDNGSITVTSGILARKPQPSSSAVSMVNSGLEAFARAAALESPRGIRINTVSPPWVSETLAEMGMDPEAGLPADVVAKAYARAVTGSDNGAVIEP